MTYRDLIKNVAERVGLPYNQTEKIIDTFLEVTKDKIIEGRSVRLKKFATLKPTESSPRNRYIPGSGEVIPYPKKKGVKMIISPSLKETLNSP